MLFVLLWMVIGGFINSPRPERTIVYLVGQGELPTWSISEGVSKLLTLVIIIVLVLAPVIFLAWFLSWIKEEKLDYWLDIPSFIGIAISTIFYAIPIIMTIVRLYHGSVDPTKGFGIFIFLDVLVSVGIYALLAITSKRPFASILAAVTTSMYGWLIATGIVTVIAEVIAIFGLIAIIVLIILAIILVWLVS